MGKALNEKTLEINLCSEISRFFRLIGFQSIWRGLAQHEEKKWGFDTALSLPGGRLFFIQWKAVKQIKKSGGYAYSLNDLQMTRLARLGKRYPGSVAYGLPRIFDWSDYRSKQFFALPYTDFLDAGLLSTHPSLGTQKSHTDLRPDFSTT